MKLAAISDTHGRHSKLKISPVDVLIHAGDISSVGTYQQVKEFLTWFSKQPAKYKIFIAGNHDFFFDYDWKPYTEFGNVRMRPYAKQYSKDDILALLEEFPSITYLENSSITIEGVKFYGTPYSSWFHDWAFNRERGNDSQKEWDKIDVDTNVLIVHGPPYRKGDELLRTNPGELDINVGCKDLLSTIESKLHNLTYCISGHIHDNRRVLNYGLKEEKGVKYINASTLDDDYSFANDPYYFEIEK